MFGPCCEKSNYEMSTMQNVMLRVAIVLGMLVAVVAILYLTPLPERHFKSCDRPCDTLDWPMICRVRLELAPAALSNATGPRRPLAVNGQTPGPPIQVCENDVLVVDVSNRLQGHSLAVHWHGQLHPQSPHADGVPLVTQCPIPPYTTFQYKFRASTPGTHFYHAHSDLARTRGLFGALVVRRPDILEPHRKHHDFDRKEHTIVVAETGDSAFRVAPAVFRVARNRRYRFRAVHAGGESGCPATLTVDDHPLKVIAVDGNPLTPIEVDSVVFGKGERVDFVLKTDRRSRNHFLRVKSCAGEGSALISYQEGGDDEQGSASKFTPGGRSFDTAACTSTPGRVCLGDAKSVEEIPRELRRDPEKVVYLSFGPRTLTNVNDEFSARVYGINNLTFTYPSSPLLTQLDQVALSSVCDGEHVPERCQGRDVCECVHVEYVPLGVATEVLLINQDEEEHVFHLHGHRFYVVGHRGFPEIPATEEIKSLDSRDALFERNVNRPASKDTIRIGARSVVALRFLADNPGFWILRDEKSKGWTRGMDIIFQVGEPADMVSAPEDFPTCGNYIGPDFFLM